MTLRFSTHKSLFFRVRNISPPYSGPPSTAQDLAIALTRALTRQSALTQAHALAGKGRSLNFCQNFLMQQNLSKVR